MQSDCLLCPFCSSGTPSFLFRSIITYLVSLFLRYLQILHTSLFPFPPFTITFGPLSCSARPLSPSSHSFPFSNVTLLSPNLPCPSISFIYPISSFDFLPLSASSPSLFHWIPTFPNLCVHQPPVPPSTVWPPCLTHPHPGSMLGVMTSSDGARGFLDDGSPWRPFKSHWVPVRKRTTLRLSVIVTWLSKNVQILNRWIHFWMAECLLMSNEFVRIFQEYYRSFKLFFYWLLNPYVYLLSWSGNYANDAFWNLNEVLFCLSSKIYVMFICFLCDGFLYYREQFTESIPWWLYHIFPPFLCHCKIHGHKHIYSCLF